MCAIVRKPAVPKPLWPSFVIAEASITIDLSSLQIKRADVVARARRKVPLHQQWNDKSRC
jgi:hypothetical protein